MAVDMFIKIDGVTGESQDDKHKNETDVLAWSWGCSQSGTTHMGEGGGAGKVNIQDLSFTKYVDKATPTLLNFCCTGKHVATATLSVRKAGGDAPLDYFVLELEECLITSISSGGSGGEDRFTENITINFRTFNEKYQAQKKDGTADGGPVTFKYDIAANKKI